MTRKRKPSFQSRPAVYEVRLAREITQTQTALVRVEAINVAEARLSAQLLLAADEIGPDEWCTDMLDPPRHGTPEITEITPITERQR